MESFWGFDITVGIPIRAFLGSNIRVGISAKTKWNLILEKVREDIPVKLLKSSE